MEKPRTLKEKIKPEILGDVMKVRIPDSSLMGIVFGPKGQERVIFPIGSDIKFCPIDEVGINNIRAYSIQTMKMGKRNVELFAILQDVIQSGTLMRARPSQLRRKLSSRAGFFWRQLRDIA